MSRIAAKIRYFQSSDRISRPLLFGLLELFISEGECTRCKNVFEKNARKMKHPSNAISFENQVSEAFKEICAAAEEACLAINNVFLLS